MKSLVKSRWVESIMSQLVGAKVLFLQNSAINESVALYDLAGYLKSLGVITRLFLSHEERRLSDKIKEFAPDMVVVPCDLLGHNSALELARIAKEATGATVVVGGTHPTFYPNVVLQKGVDYAFAGEAEGVVEDLLRCVIEGKDPSEIKNLIVRQNGSYKVNQFRPLMSNLDELPMPDREICYRYRFIAAFPWKKFGTGRGCMNSCGFCFNPTYRSMLNLPDPRHQFLRRKSPERIVREINDVRSRYPLRIAHFSDDLFTSGLEWVEPFVEVYRKNVAVPFSCNVYASTINEKTVKLLKEGGCRVVAMGIELGDDEIRMKVVNKPITTAQILEAARLIKSFGMRLATFNILGVPWSGVDKDIDTLVLNQKIKTDNARVTVLVPFPKSALTKKLIEEGFLVKDFEERIYEVPDIPHWPAESLFTRTDPKRVMRLYSLWSLAVKLRLPKSWIRRLVNSRFSSLLTPLSFVIALINEKKIFGFGWLDGFRYFLHVKNPALKTKNYVSFI